MKLFLIFLNVTFGSILALTSYSSSSESCEDSRSHGHSHEHHHNHEHSGGGGSGANRGCPRGWRRFNRPSGGWCVKVFGGADQIQAQATAEAQCQAQGATLSGLQNEAEIVWITSQAVPLIAPHSSGSLWIGAHRTSPNSNSFRWTDNSATGMAGFLWNVRQPDNQHGRTQQCVVLLAANTPTVRDDLWTWNANRLDDVTCSSAGGRVQRMVRGYVCGKRVTRE